MRTIFVGDVHGCAEPFSRLLETLEYRKEADRLYLVGDAFTRGPDPLGVWDQILSTGAQMVRGNHDHRLLLRLKRRRLGRERPMKPDRKRVVDTLMPVAGELEPWLDRLRPWIVGRGWLLVHAGINPEKGLEGTSRREFMTIRTWPPTDDLAGPRWYEEYRGSRLIIFGHDAPRGLVVRRRPDGRPYLLGIDTGCCFGNPLTAYILEEDRIVQVEGWRRPRKSVSSRVSKEEK